MPHFHKTLSFRDELPGLQVRVVRALAATEAFLSLTEFDIKNHNLSHAVQSIKVHGEMECLPGWTHVAV